MEKELRLLIEERTKELTEKYPFVNCINEVKSVLSYDNIDNLPLFTNSITSMGKTRSSINSVWIRGLQDNLVTMDLFLKAREHYGYSWDYVRD